MKIEDKSAENLINYTKMYKNLPLKAESKISRDIQLRTQAEEMESIFLTKMIKTMEQTIPKRDDSSSNTLSSMMFAGEMGKTMAKSGGIGLAKFIYNALKDKDVDLGEELSKLNNDLNQDNTQMLNLNNKVF